MKMSKFQVYLSLLFCLSFGRTLAHPSIQIFDKGYATFTVGETDSRAAFEAANSMLTQQELESAERGFLDAILLGHPEPWECYYKLAYIAALKGDSQFSAMYLEDAFESKKRKVKSACAPPHRLLVSSSCPPF